MSEFNSLSRTADNEIHVSLFPHIDNMQGDKPLSEPVMVSLLTHICVTRPQ